MKNATPKGVAFLLFANNIKFIKKLMRQKNSEKYHSYLIRIENNKTKK